MKHNITKYPCRYVILIARPKSMGGDTGLLSYGAPDQPYPERLMSRGFGCMFKSREAAVKALEKSLEADKALPYVKKCQFLVAPVYQTWGTAK